MSQLSIKCKAREYFGPDDKLILSIKLMICDFKDVCK